MLKLILIFLAIFYNTNIFSKDVQEEVNKKKFCENNSNYFIKNINVNLYPKKIFIKTKETKSWYINLIKSFYSTPRSEWKIDHNFKKYKRAKIRLYYGDNIFCEFEGKIKIHGGRKDHVDIKNLTSSIRVKIFDGHLNHSRHFALMVPSTKLDDNEIFITEFVHELGIISPDTFYTNVKINNNKEFKMIFQDMDYTEILRRNNRIDGVIIAENKTKKNKYNLTRALNTEKQILGTGWKRNKNYYLNALDKTNYLVLNEKFYKQENILLNENNYFINHDKFKDFYLLISATNGFHGTQFGDRRYYYNLILDKIEPVYYDWRSNILDKNFKNSKSSINFKVSDEHVKSLIKKIENINLDNFNKTLKTKGVNISKKKLSDTIKKIVQYLNTYKSNFKYDNENKHVNFDYKDNLIFHINENTYEVCNKNLNCEEIKINEDVEKMLFQNHEIMHNNKIIKFTRKRKDNFKSNNIPKPNTINLFNKINLENDLKLYFNNDVNVFTNEKNISLEYLNDNGRVYFIDGNVKNFNIDVFNSNKYVKRIKNLDQNYIPYCLTFYNTELDNLTIEASRLNCSKAIRFSNTSGNIKKLIVNNSSSDAVSAEISNLKIFKTIIKNAGDDCLDFETGNYIFNSLELDGCTDKAFQVKRKSNVKVKKIKISNSKYGFSVLDSSLLKIDLSNIETVKECLIVYRENDGYYGSLAKVTNNFKCNKSKFFQDKSSQIINK